MAAHARTVEIPEADRRELQRRARSKGAPAREVERARIVLLAGDGVPGKQIAARVGCAEPTVVTWRRRYAESGLGGLEDLPRPGSPSPLPESLRDRVLQLTLTQPPTSLGATHWSSRLLATALAAEATPIALHADLGLLAEPGRGVLLDHHLPGPAPRQLPDRGRPHRRDRPLHRRLERPLRPLHLDQGPRHDHRQGHQPTEPENYNHVSYGALGRTDPRSRAPTLYAASRLRGR